MSDTKPEVETVRLLLQEAYADVRSYRDKEFQTFAFGFVVLGAGFTDPFAGNITIKLLLSAFGGMMLAYLWKNLTRSISLRKAIAEHYARLGVTDEVAAPLKPSEWASKPRWKHLGTTLYLTILALETTALWVHWPKP